MFKIGLAQAGGTAGSISVLGLLLVVVIAGSLLFAIGSAVKQKRWGFVIALPILAGTGMMLLMLVGYRQVSQDFGGTPAVVELAPPTLPTVPDVPRAAPITDADLMVVASAPPRIELNDEPSQPAAESEPVAEVEEFIDLDSVVTDETESPAVGNRPDWIDAEPKPNQQVFLTNPYATPAACRDEARRQLVDWVWEQTALQQPDLGAEPPAWWGEKLNEIQERTQAQTYLERREVSVGTVYLLHTLGEVEAEDQDWLAEHAQEWVTQNRRERGVQRVALGGGAILAGVAVLHGFLRSGSRRSTDPGG